MSTRLEKKKDKNKQLNKVNDKQFDLLFSIYDQYLDKLYRKLGRKTDSINWVEQGYPSLDFLNISNTETIGSWVLPADNSRKKILEIQSNGDLLADITLVEGDSFYLQTGGMDINTPPINKNDWKLIGGCKYRVLIDADYGENRPDCAVFIIQYSEKERIAHKFQQVYHGLNTIEFDAVDEAQFIRIAFRFKGEGFLRIKPIKIHSEDMLPIREISLEGSNNFDDIKRLFELKSKTLETALEKRVYALPDSPKIHNNKLQELESKLATALYEKQSIERSLEYKLGKTFSRTKYRNFSDLLALPKKLIKVRAANRKGKFTPLKFNEDLKVKLLESVGVFNESRPDEEITWPPFEPRALLRNQDINVVSISDQFTYECFRYEANFIQLTKKNWQAEIDAAKPVMFFVESAWNGNNGEWTYTMASYKKHLGDPLREAIKYCQSKNIPVVFWNKEDPTNYDVFIDVASDCDYIFTTDGGIVEKYKARVKHDRVYPLAFAAQPAIHNPIRDKRKQLPEYEVCFAGSWYNNGHDTRRIQTEIVLDGATSYDLHIYDRMLHAKKHRESRIFPAKYQPFIAGSLTYDQMVTAYRQYKVFLNINTVQDSPTMFSRRVFEILACGTPVVSTHSDGMNEMLGDHVFIVNDKNETNSVVKKLLGSDIERERIGHLAARYCLSHHSYQQRFDEILKVMGIDYHNKNDDMISVIMCTNRPKNIDLMIENFLRQNHSNKQLLIVLNNDEFNIDVVSKKIEHISNAYVFQLQENMTLGDCLNFGVEKADGDYIAKMDDDDIYGENYLSDSLLAFNFSGADVVGKDSYFCYVESKDVMAIKQPNKDNRYSDFISGGTLVIRKHVFEKVKFHSRNRGEDTNFLKDCKSNGFLIYSSDKYNFIQMRYSNTSAHTWTIEDEEYLNNCQVVSNKLDINLSQV